MPKNGEISRADGVYRSLCCGREIMVRENDPFPDCPGHPNLSTVWKLRREEPILKVADLKIFRKKNEPAA
jgi:hypothetical protein